MAYRNPLTIALLLSMASCGPSPLPQPTPQTTAPVPSTPTAAVPAARWDGRPNGFAWTRDSLAALETVGQGLVATVPSDIAAYCPAYGTASPENRRAFWVGLVSALARHESDFRPELSYQENFPDAQGRPVISRGLLQVSQESANGYSCGISDPQQLHEPRTNLTCGIRIANRLVTRDGMIGSTGAPWGEDRAQAGLQAQWQQL